MLENFIFSANCVLPIFVIIFLGWTIRRLKIADQKAFDGINNIAFTIALPLLIFRDLINSDFKSFFDAKLLIFVISATIISFAVSWTCAEIFIKDKPSVGAFVQGSFRSNYAVIGLALLRNLVGEENAARGAIILAFIIPVYNIGSVVVLTIRGEKHKASLKNSLVNICKNPLIIGVAAGLAVSLSGIKLPVILNTSVNYMANIASPLALIVIGGSINFEKVKSNFKLSLICSLIKTVLIPAVFVPISVFLGFRGIPLLILLITFGSPTAIASYIMAQKMKSNPDLAANVVLMTSAISVFTFTFSIFVLKNLNLV